MFSATYYSSKFDMTTHLTGRSRLTPEHSRSINMSKVFFSTTVILEAPICLFRRIASPQRRNYIRYLSSDVGGPHTCAKVDSRLPIRRTVAHQRGWSLMCLLDMSLLYDFFTLTNWILSSRFQKWLKTYRSTVRNACFH